MTNQLGLLKQWVKVGFAIALSIFFWVTFTSLFLAVMTFTFLFFVPSANKKIEDAASTFVFTLGMAFILFFAFVSEETLGLGLNIDLVNTLIPLGEGVMVGILWTLFGAMIAKAIFSIAATRGAEEPKSMLWLVDVIIYVILVGLLVVLQPWTWDTSTIVFIAIFVLGYISGSAGDKESRQAIGVILIVVSFVIFSMGIGTQLVGQGLFGEWFPTVYQGITTVTQPLGDVFSDLGAMFGNALFLITNPTGYAQSIINGTFQQDPDTGLTGALGVEFIELKTTPIIVENPYTAFIGIQNKASATAENVRVSLVLGGKAPGTTDFTFAPSPVYYALYQDLPVEWETANLQELGFHTGIDANGVTCSAQSCWQWIDGKEENKLLKIDQRQTFFVAEEGIVCEDVVRYNLREQFIPFVAQVEYRHSVDSNLGMELISRLEYDRLATEGGFFSQSKIPTNLKNAPVFLNIDTLEQPILENTPLYVGVNLVSARSQGIVSNPLITLELPPELVERQKNPIACTPKENTAISDVNNGVFRWDGLENFLVYCTLDPFVFSPEDGSSITFHIRASANYTFTEFEELVPAKLEFGGVRCCEGPGECPASQACVKNQCGALPDFGTPDYCKDLKEVGLECNLGDGGCDSGACGPDSYSVNLAGGIEPLTCRSVSGIPINVCCPAGAPESACVKAYEAALAGKSNTEVVAAYSAELV